MREHIEFIQAQCLPWQDAAPLGAPGARLKLLSLDQADRSFSCVLALPPGFARRASAHDFDEEIFVLDGDLSVGDSKLGENVYAFCAAGGAEGAWMTRGGANLLYFRSGIVDAAQRAPQAVSRRSTPPVALADTVWDGDFEKLGLGALQAGARMKILREDPFSGETTYVSASIAFRRGVRSERHPIVQEFFMLAGELDSEYGVMRAGAYCFRPPMFKHGPYASTTGAVILFRGLGGRQETIWEDAAGVRLDAPHAPILPERLRGCGAPVARAPRY